MYLMIKETPTSEQIQTFNMKVNEDDLYLNYKIELSVLSDALLVALIDLFKINSSSLEGKQYITLSRSLEV